MAIIHKNKIKELNSDKPHARFNLVPGSSYLINIDIPATPEAALLFLEAIDENDMIIIASTNLSKIEIEGKQYFRYNGCISKADAAKVIHKINSNLKSIRQMV